MNQKPLVYTLDANKVPIPCFDTLEWAEWFGKTDRRVGLTEGDGWHVSTVFVGTDSNLFDGPPILFETMVFWNEEVGDLERYRTWAEAAAGHERIASMLEYEARQAEQRSWAAIKAAATHQSNSEAP